MRAFAIILAFACGLARSAHAEGTPNPETSSPITRENRQLLLVRSPSWFASRGTLERYERDAEGRWISVGSAGPVSIGRNGMAWGRGLHGEPESEPLKREGDHRSPAGVFALSGAFGAAGALPEGAHGLPYLHTLASTYCVEDSRSGLYNQIIDARDVTRTSWEQWSELRRADGLFDWAVVVRQNAPDVRKKAGSCVFLHIWRGPRSPTAGCTAMPREQIEAIVRWLDPRAEPVLVQLPEPVFQERREPWALP